MYPMHARRHGSEPTIGLAEFFEIWGGSPDLQLPGVWFHWCNTAMLLAAWRKVGFAGGRIDGTLIDRTHFIDRVPVGSPSSSTRSSTLAAVDTLVRTPPGMRGQSLAGVQAKFDAVHAHALALEARIAALEAAPFDAECVPFLMQPKALAEKKKRDRSQVDMSIYEGGSASLRNLRAVFVEKRAQAAEKTAAVAGRKDERAARATQAAADTAAFEAAFDVCALVCVCGVTPCPMLDMKRCDTCYAAGRPSVKPRICVVRECVAARKGPTVLQLTCAMATPIRAMQLVPAMEEAEEEHGPSDEVMPTKKPLAQRSSVVRCDYDCEHPVMTPEEALAGFCSGRRCKAKVHHFCFIQAVGERAEAFSSSTRYCKSCWAAL